jgi:hypothetical protein
MLPKPRRSQNPTDRILDAAKARGLPFSASGVPERPLERFIRFSSTILVLDAVRRRRSRLVASVHNNFGPAQ